MHHLFARTLTLVDPLNARARHSVFVFKRRADNLKPPRRREFDERLPDGFVINRVTTTSTPFGKICPFDGACPNIPNASPSPTFSPSRVPALSSRAGLSPSNCNGNTCFGTDASKTRIRNTSSDASRARIVSMRSCNTRKSTGEDLEASPSDASCAPASSLDARARGARLVRPRATPRRCSGADRAGARARCGARERHRTRVK